MAKPTAEMSEIEKEATALAKLKFKEAQATENLEKADKLNKRYLRALEQAQMARNDVQIVTGVGAAVAGTAGGVLLNRRLRRYTAEKKMVTVKGERTLGAMAISEGAPIVVGSGIAVWGFFVDNSVAAAGMIGGGIGLAAGTGLNALTEPKQVIKP